MPRLMLTDALWAKLSQLMHHTGRVYNKPVHRLTLEGILFRMRTGSPWRDLPAHFGRWISDAKPAAYSTYINASQMQ